jgi:Immunity protein 7
MTGRLRANYGNLYRVFEWHGWATIVASPDTEDDTAAEARQRDAEARVARVIAGAAGVANETLDVRSANGRVHLWLAGSHNHRDETVTDLFRSIAAAAPGSYGVMYVLDDDVNSTWERLVMRRGTVSQEVDTSLSPHIGVVEDPPDP